jgi:hypothetical protein
MVAIDEPQGAPQKLGQGHQLLPQINGEADSSVDQVAEHHHLGGAEAMGQLQQDIQAGGIPIAGKGNTVGLEDLGLAEMEISDEQAALLRIPDGSLGQQIEPISPPDEGCVRRGGLQAAPIAFWYRGLLRVASMVVCTAG